ncbi:2-succinyl-6-hydroxy-2,4-cyclohexadiene-1-carboxylate synthase [Heyndrickxia sporothermodurans]|uniref:Putative 2-succinyl-6-hydroxy-2,4-cyclohexadiene-1-carboxylate synthase n=2 Tax=Heyndrickxia sporothermodurans TaxID=46224 RepID=A0AB37H4E9_9BACI|nr:2-succinyl-6-hydroxy-2,4-cyclohexadiene-1-carboxylate synthase [Heyndrickxia sporothermodurans]MBL5767966.1 2-succinyl-6-hydroxy-2,4-cyclohexadiene-1-carboxylate synthase [Heyndrickxia sporothermodurans]MBL5771489.1 2-succinyl-6-hydroxy-2,4-cyclohexadiene-1-carboxylate synthase [Heyndrickxia sporothermodurans]MBL5775259.1 2-succinyl-6-hydroxy-2,4-cyclohexadiene-1-carboxylate synthase [Heyndrickxia sporothermodurans]MBL5778636.1 2-succinyl-6-hydroxy-2,4-cyclohexadiene-1-carboxylate synthase [
MMIEVNDVNYHVNIVGKGEPIVMLHGFTGDMSSWDAINPYLEEEYQLILIDILGHGKTEIPLNYERYHIEKVAKDIREILIHLKIIKTNLLGYSMGGRLALTFTILYPNMVNKLILESASPGIETEEGRKLRRENDEKLANKIVNEGIESFVQYWTNIPLFKSQKRLDYSMQEKVRQQRLRNDPIGLANSLKGMGTGSMPSLWGRLHELEIPVLILSGSLDEKYCEIGKKMENNLSQAMHYIIEDIGHAIHVEDSQKFGTIIKEFLSNK